MNISIKEFKQVSDVGTNPLWPQHTGTTTWKFNRGHKTYTLEIARLGGVTARTVYHLYYGKRKTYLSSVEGHTFSLRIWMSEILATKGDKLTQQ